MIGVVETEIQQVPKVMGILFTQDEQERVSNLMESWNMTLEEYAKHCMLMIADTHTREDGSIR